MHKLRFPVIKRACNLYFCSNFVVAISQIERHFVVPFVSRSVCGTQMFVDVLLFFGKKKTTFSAEIFEYNLCERYNGIVWKKKEIKRIKENKYRQKDIPQFMHVIRLQPHLFMNTVRQKGQVYGPELLRYSDWENKMTDNKKIIV